MRVIPRRERRSWGLVILSLFALTFCFLGTALLTLDESSRHSPQWLSVPLRSKLAANYGSEPRPTPLVALDWTLLEDSIRNDETHHADAPGRIATLTNQMQTPVSGRNIMPTPRAIFTPLPATETPIPAFPRQQSEPEPKPVPTTVPAPGPLTEPTLAAPTAAPVPTDTGKKETKPTSVPQLPTEPKPTNAPKPTAEPKPTKSNK